MSSRFSLAFISRGRFVQPGGEFFQEGDTFCYSKAKHFIQDEDIEQLSNLVSCVALGKSPINGTDSLIACEVKGCNEAFDTTNAYDVHFENSHRFSCRECKLNFPSNFLLDVHIDESHDSFFTAKRERGEAHLVCLVESCSTKFKHEKERQQHLVNSHKYPSNFRFSRSRKKNSRDNKAKGGVADRTLREGIDSMEIDERSSCCQVEYDDGTRCNGHMESEEKLQAGFRPRGIPGTINFGRGSSKMFHRTRGKRH